MDRVYLFHIHSTPFIITCYALHVNGFVVYGAVNSEHESKPEDRSAAGACLKNAFCQMCVPLGGRFGPNERGAVGCVK